VEHECVLRLVCGLGVATARTVSKLLDMDRGSAALALSELERAGYLMKRRGSPTVYICVRRYREAVVKALCNLLGRTRVVSVSEVMKAAGLRNRPLASALIRHILEPYIQDARRSRGKKKLIVSERAYQELCLSVS
jgi:transcriptional regulator with AAA-type ATPase domain